MDIVSYLLGKNSSSGNNLEEYFTDEIPSGTSFNNTNPGWTNLVKKLPPMKQPNATDFSGLFSYFKGETIDTSLLNTSNVTSVKFIFSNCINLKILDISHFDMGKVTNCSNMFQQCSSLQNLTFGTNLGKAFTSRSEHNSNYNVDVSYSSNLTHDSLMSVINNLYDLNLSYDVEGGGTLYRQYLILGNTNLAKLSNAEKQIATDKGWDLL